ncbi:helix-turn-helix transcriptional regulator [Novosphingobium sp. KCTC 2891]|uniref:helix-turn-helix transcriptional regulator n=1 Tax=Novosphingobium sp. KCTC 2891 TaxID=2989730 RepID=UPI0022231C65|nr:helix-turn-helix transcriptional regulator [Novosphingobium sp. KCTC 2891]MCW1385013.1 helix-turn-helix transcriptional regulator [Novosphingobium sp. KCTC 2891]
MRTTLWEEVVGGLSLARVSYAWADGDLLSEVHHAMTLKHAEARRPVNAKLLNACNGGHRIGRLVLTPPDIAVKVRAVEAEDNFIVRMFQFDPTWLNNQLCDGVNFDFRAVPFMPSIDHPLIHSTLERIYDEVMSRRPGWHGMVEALLRLLCLDIARLSQGADAADEDNGGAVALTADQLEAVRQAMTSIDIADLSTTRVASVMGMGVTRLRQAFRKTTGQTLRAEIESVRTEHARARLEETQLPLKVIAHELGFAHASSFCHAFKKAMGMTPTDYRERPRRCVNRPGELIHVV